jgi:hypothetical protein
MQLKLLQKASGALGAALGEDVVQRVEPLTSFEDL